MSRLLPLCYPLIPRGPGNCFSDMLGLLAKRPELSLQMANHIARLGQEHIPAWKLQRVAISVGITMQNALLPTLNPRNSWWQCFDQKEGWHQAFFVSALILSVLHAEDDIVSNRPRIKQTFLLLTTGLEVGLAVSSKFLFFKHLGVGGMPMIWGINFGSELSGGGPETLEKQDRKNRRRLSQRIRWAIYGRFP